MIDIKLIREQPDVVQQNCTKKNDGSDIDRVVSLDVRRREIIQRVEDLKSKRNNVSQEVAVLKKSGGDASDLIIAMRDVGEEIKGLDEELRSVEEEIESVMLRIPSTYLSDSEFSISSVGQRSLVQDSVSMLEKVRV
jgi:seryl-tRNA synthetase